jgi:hypothetical protein
MLDAGALAAWTGRCDELLLAVVASEGVLLSWKQVRRSYWMVSYRAALLLS